MDDVGTEQCCHQRKNKLETDEYKWSTMRVSKKIKIAQAQFVPLDTARLAKHRSIPVMSASDKVEMSIKRRWMAVGSQSTQQRRCCPVLLQRNFYFLEVLIAGKGSASCCFMRCGPGAYVKESKK